MSLLIVDAIDNCKVSESVRELELVAKCFLCALIFSYMKIYLQGGDGLKVSYN